MSFRKKWLPVIIAGSAALTCLLLFACYQKVAGERERNLAIYCSQINQQIRDKEFSTAHISDGNVYLFDQEGNWSETVCIEGHRQEKDRQIVSIRKNKSAIYFVLSSDENDETGIMFLNNSAWLSGGIGSLKRMGLGYEYDTRQPSTAYRRARKPA